MESVTGKLEIKLSTVVYTLKITQRPGQKDHFLMIQKINPVLLIRFFAP